MTHAASPATSPPKRPPADAAVDLRGVRKAFRRGASATPVLRGIDLSIARGESVYLLGPSGSGKTTLLSIIGALLTPDAGDVRVLGHAVAKLSTSERAVLRRRYIGFVFQRFHLIRGLTAAENVAAPLRLDGQGAAAARRRALELLDRVGLADLADESPSRMSVGQCQRVALARALVADPAIVLADEPTASLDAETGLAAVRLLRELTVEANKTLVVVTHDHRIVPAGGGSERTVAMESGSLRPAAPSPAALPPSPG